MPYFPPSTAATPTLNQVLAAGNTTGRDATLADLTLTNGIINLLAGAINSVDSSTLKIESGGGNQTILELSASGISTNSGNVLDAASTGNMSTVGNFVFATVGKGLTFYDSTTLTSAPTLDSVVQNNNATSYGIEVGSIQIDYGAITFPDGSQQTTAFTGPAPIPTLSEVLTTGNDCGESPISDVNQLYFTSGASIVDDGNGGINLFDVSGFYLQIDSGSGGVFTSGGTSGGNTLDDGNGHMVVSGNLTINGSIQFGDASEQTTAFQGYAASHLTGTLSNARLPSAISVTTLQGAYINTLATKTSAYTLTTSDSVILVNSASNIIMTLPSAFTAGAGREYTIKTIQSAATVKTSASGQKIDGTDYSSTGLSLSANNKYISIVSDGSTNWYIVASN